MIAAIPLDDHLVGGVTGLTKLGIADLDHGGKVTQSLSTQGGAATNLSSAVASPNRLALALGDVDGTVTVISRSNPGILWKYRRQGASYRVNGLVYSDDSSRLLVSYQDETGSVLDAKNGRLLHTFAKGATSAFSHDGRLIAMSAYNGRITFNDSKNFKPVGAPLSGGSAFLASLRFSADGKWLIAVDSENKLLIFDVATRREIGLPIRSATGGNGQIAIANDGGMVAITTDQGIALWPLDPNSWAKAVCSAAARNLTRAEWTTYVGGPYQIVCPEWPAGA